MLSKERHQTATGPTCFCWFGSWKPRVGYDDFYRGVSAPPPHPLTATTVGGVLSWQDEVDATSRSEAAGGYMIMEDTLRDIIGSAGVLLSDKFDEQTQDKLGVHLARHAGWDAFERGEMPVRQFGNQLASVWAALPLLTGQSRGKSRYHGLAGNRALISADRFEHILANLGAVDVASEVKSEWGTSTAIAAVVPKSLVQKANDGFAPSRIVRWTSDPFYQE